MSAISRLSSPRREHSTDTGSHGHGQREVVSSFLIFHWCILPLDWYIHAIKAGSTGSIRDPLMAETIGHTGPCPGTLVQLHHSTTVGQKPDRQY